MISILGILLLQIIASANKVEIGTGLLVASLLGCLVFEFLWMVALAQPNNKAKE